MSQPNEPAGRPPEDGPADDRDEREERGDRPDEGTPAVDPDAPARTLVDPDAPSVEPNEPA